MILGGLYIKSLTDAAIFVKNYTNFKATYKCKFCFKYLNFTIEFETFNKYFNISEERTWTLLQFQYFLLYIVPEQVKLTSWYYYPNYEEKDPVWFIPFSFIDDGLIYYDFVEFKSIAPDLTYYPIFCNNKKIFTTIYDTDNTTIIPYASPERLTWYMNAPGNQPTTIPPAQSISISFDNKNGVFGYTHYELMFVKNSLNCFSGSQRYIFTSTGTPVEVYIQGWKELLTIPLSQVSNENYMWPLAICFKNDENASLTTGTVTFYTSRTIKNFDVLAASKPIVGNDYVQFYKNINTGNMAFKEYFNIQDENFFQGYKFDGVNLVLDSNFCCYYQENYNIIDNTQLVWPPSQQYRSAFDPGDYSFVFAYSKYSQAAPYVDASIAGDIGYKNYYNFTKLNFDSKTFDYIPSNSRVTVVHKYLKNNTLTTFPKLFTTFYQSKTGGLNLSRASKITNGQFVVKLDQINYTAYAPSINYTIPVAGLYWPTQKQYVPSLQTNPDFCYNDKPFYLGLRAYDFNYDYIYHCKQKVDLSIVFKKNIDLSLTTVELNFAILNKLDLSQFKFYSLKYAPLPSTFLYASDTNQPIFRGAIYCNLSKISNLTNSLPPITIAQGNGQHNNYHNITNLYINSELKITIKNTFTDIIASSSYDCYFQLNFSK